METFLKWTRRGLLTVGSLGFFVGLVVSADEAWRSVGLGIMVGSIPLALLGQVLVTAADAGWMIAIGLVGWIALMALGVYLTDFGGMVGAMGGLLFPASILLFGAWGVWSLFAPYRKAARLRATGLSASARIVAIELSCIRHSIVIANSNPS